MNFEIIIVNLHEGNLLGCIKGCAFVYTCACGLSGNLCLLLVLASFKAGNVMIPNCMHDSLSVE